MSPLTLLNGGLRTHNGALVLSASSSSPCCCESPPPPPLVCDCESDDYYDEFFLYEFVESPVLGGGGGPCRSPFYIRGEQQFTIPSNIPLPVKIVLDGACADCGVDDDIVFNGSVIQEGQFPFSGGCNGAHQFTYCECYNGTRTITLATRDNFGVGMGAKVYVRFCKLCESFADNVIGNSRPFIRTGNAEGTGPLCYPPQVTHTLNVQVPDCLSLPAKVRVTADIVDDDIRVNGVIVEAGQHSGPGANVNGDPSLFYDCNIPHSIDYEFVSNNRTVTLEIIDNFGGVCGYRNLKVCFSAP